MNICRRWFTTSFRIVIALGIVIWKKIVYIITVGNSKYSRVRAALNRIIMKAG